MKRVNQHQGKGAIQEADNRLKSKDTRMEGLVNSKGEGTASTGASPEWGSYSAGARARRSSPQNDGGNGGRVAL